ncbi:hypothetical protein EVAR_80543_1 [Eumeta japonica]|uniref:Uncharacterized protein n=1 Tax=Eumeta variegata TaxID=151549 RepID=A0A4C1TLI3_EUMVA|nr:hypothetical protein EVAR_80543_1 [Eumeta japonica]
MTEQARYFFEQQRVAGGRCWWHLTSLIKRVHPQTPLPTKHVRRSARAAPCEIYQNFYGLPFAVINIMRISSFTASNRSFDISTMNGPRLPRTKSALSPRGVVLLGKRGRRPLVTFETARALSNGGR